MSAETTEKAEAEVFTAKVTVFVSVTLEVKPSGSGELTVKQAGHRAATAAYEKVRDAFGSTFSIIQPPRIEVVA
jgi:hypothetical protein